MLLGLFLLVVVDPSRYAASLDLHDSLLLYLILGHEAQCASKLLTCCRMLHLAVLCNCLFQVQCSCHAIHALCSDVFAEVLNVMTGVFCQSAIESAERDHELILQNVAHAALMHANTGCLMSSQSYHPCQRLCGVRIGLGCCFLQLSNSCLKRFALTD